MLLFVNKILSRWHTFCIRRKGVDIEKGVTVFHRSPILLIGKGIEIKLVKTHTLGVHEDECMQVCRSIAKYSVMPIMQKFLLGVIVVSMGRIYMLASQ